MRKILTTSIVLGIVVLAGCKPENPVEETPPQVTVSLPVRQPVTRYLDLTGTTAASRTVTLMARVEGFLQSIQFDDGSMVKAGQPLFIIETAPYEAKVKLNEASVEQANAHLKGAQIEYDRQLRLIRQDATARSSVDKWKADRDAAEAAVSQAKANAELARINYGYTQITAPFDGRVGRHQVDLGNLVGVPSPTALVTIEQLDPIFIYFNVSEDDVLAIRASMKASGDASNSLSDVPVFVALTGEDSVKHQGKLDFVASGVEVKSGTLQARAILPNADYFFLPGYFVRVRIPLGEPEEKLLVPDAAVGHDQFGAYVLVVDSENVVGLRHVKVGQQEGNLRVVTEGIEDKDRVVIDGLQSAIPDRKVSPLEKQIPPNLPS